MTDTTLQKTRKQEIVYPDCANCHTPNNSRAPYFCYSCTYKVISEVRKKDPRAFRIRGTVPFMYMDNIEKPTSCLINGCESVCHCP